MPRKLFTARPPKKNKWIRIVATPSGQAPEWVRHAWVGVAMETQQPCNGIQTGVLGGQSQNGKDGYSVWTMHAVQRLGEKNRDAAQWFRDQRLEIPNTSLVFPREVCEEIDRASP